MMSRLGMVRRVCACCVCLLFSFFASLAGDCPQDVWEKVQQRFPGATMEPVAGGGTNHNFRLQVGEAVYFLRVGGDSRGALGLDGDREMNCTQQAAQIGLAPEVVLYWPEAHLMVSRWVECTSSNVDLEEKAILDKAMAQVRLLHESTLVFPTFCSGYDVIEKYLATVKELEATLPEALTQTLLPAVNQIHEVLGDPDSVAPCHLDLHRGNFMVEGEKLWIVDWEYAAMGDPLFDLAVLSSTEGYSDNQMKRLLKAYRGEATEQEFATLYLLRLVADVRWILWSLIQEKLSTVDYPIALFCEKTLRQCIERVQSPDFLEMLRTKRSLGERTPVLRWPEYRQRQAVCCF